MKTSSTSIISRFIQTTCLVVMTLPLFAQTEKGNVTIGLHNFSPSGINIQGIPTNLFAKGTAFGVSWGRSKSYDENHKLVESQSVYTLGLNASGQYFIMNNLAIGASGSFFTGFSAYPQESSDVGRYSARIYLVGPEIKYFLGNGNTKAYFKTAVSAGAMNVWWDGQKEKANPITQVVAGAGTSFFISKLVSLDLGLEYNVFKLKSRDGATGVNTNLAIDVGFGLFF